MREKLLEIINHYGVGSQLKYFQSEVFELNEAIMSAEYSRYIGIVREPAKCCIEHIKEEIADVHVMLRQFQLYYGITDEEIVKIAKEKTLRQIERIKNEK